VLSFANFDFDRPNRVMKAVWRSGCLLFPCLVLSACGGGGGGGSDNAAPTASFTATPSSGNAPLVVAFDASASTDRDGSIASYSWSFGDSGSATGVAASHTFVSGGSYTVTLTVTDNRGATGQATRTITATGPPPADVTVSGRITYQRVPFFNAGVVDATAGLNYGGTFAAPARGVVVELVNAASQAVLATTTADDNGDYAMTAPADTSVFVRARAQVRSTGAWDIRVLNNTNANALYVLDSASFSTGTASVTRNLLAESGWPGFGGTTYSGTRAAAPFAIVDTLYSAVKFVRGNVDTPPSLPALAVFWSQKNTSSDDFDPSTGAILSTLYRSGANDGFPDGIYVLGLDGNDTDEYDQHVLAHEFQHFLEDVTSRTDTPGGSHSPDDRIDLRLAFSEGFANAFSGMVLADPVYKDSFGQAQGDRFDFQLENNSHPPAGWFNEGSVAGLAWDLYDAANEHPDAVALGYGPMFEVFAGELRGGPALTSLYPFIAGLKARAGAPVAAIDALVQSQSVFGTGLYGVGETNDGSVSQALPVYTTLTLGGTQRVCGTTAAGTYNALGNRLFLRFTLATAQSVTIRAEYTATGSDPGPSPDPDPDFVLYRNGFLDAADGGTPNVEELTPVGGLAAGDYVIEVYEFSHVDPSTNAARRGVTCMNVSVTN